MREETDLRLGIEADFVPGREDRMANLLEAREWDYVIGSVHFLRDGAVDLEEWDVWATGESPEEVWRRYFETLGEAARSGLFDILAHPDLVKVWGRGRPLPEGDLRRYYELAIDGIAESDVAVEVSTAGPAQAGRRDLPRPRVPRDVPRGRLPARALERRPPPRAARLRLRQALELLDRSASASSPSSSGRERRRSGR